MAPVKKGRFPFGRRVKELFWLISAPPRSRLDVSPASTQLRDVHNLALNIKFFGYELAKQVAEAIPPRTNLQPIHKDLPSKPSTQTDLESEWAAYWFQELRIPVIFHRKLWEFAYVLQALHDTDMLRAGRHGLGFGCGAEPIASYLAARNVDVIATDLPPQSRVARGWLESGQHASTLDSMFQPHLLNRETFEARVSLRFVDMNDMPDDLRNFDFCWSICALEHLGSIEKGLDFIVGSIETLRPGGVAVHTTEFNFLDDERTLDNWPTVLFQRRHFEALAARLHALGHKIAPLDFNVGTKPLDRFIDLPPLAHDWPDRLREWAGEPAHLKLSIDGFASTCFGFVITKSS